MTWVAAGFVVVAFMALLAALGVPRRAAAVVARSRTALADMRDAALDEEEKERRVQRHAVALFGAFFVVTGLSLVALLLPVGAVWLAARGGVVDFDAALDATMSWQVLVAACVFGFAWWGWARRKQA